MAAFSVQLSVSVRPLYGMEFGWQIRLRFPAPDVAFLTESAVAHDRNNIGTGPSPLVANRTGRIGSQSCAR